MAGKRSPELEEYLELLARFREEGKQPKVKMLSEGLGVSPASVSEMLRKLAEKGLVEYERYGEIRLTPKGEKEGGRILRKHRFLEDFLLKIGLKKEKAHREACALEHVLSDDVEKALRDSMGSGAGGAGKKLKRLAELKKGEGGRIVLVSGGKEACRRLTDMGLTPGTKIKIGRASSRAGAVEICVRSSCLAIGRGLAEKILVDVEE